MISASSRKLTYKHLLLTRFSHRGYEADSRGRRDPLEPRTLEHRFRLFAATCLPSILGQTVQDFQWILLIDPELPRTFRERLDGLIGSREHTSIVAVPPGIEDWKSDWIDEFVGPGHEYVVTSLLDDDDALFRGLVEYIRNFIEARHGEGGIPWFLMFGCRNAIQWDFFRARAAPLGYWKPWTRRVRLDQRVMDSPVSAGFSVLCRYPVARAQVAGLSHAFAPIYFDKDLRLEELASIQREHVEDLRRHILPILDEGEVGSMVGIPSDRLHWIAPPGIHAVMVNHLDNVQLERLFERPETRRPIDPKTLAPDVAIDFDAASRAIRLQRRGAAVLLRSAKRLVSMAWKSNIRGVRSRMAAVAKAALRAARGVAALR